MSIFSLSLLVISRIIISWSIYYMGRNPETTVLHFNMLWFVCSMNLLLYASGLIVGLVG